MDEVIFAKTGSMEVPTSCAERPIAAEADAHYFGANHYYLGIVGSSFGCERCFVLAGGELCRHWQTQNLKGR